MNSRIPTLRTTTVAIAITRMQKETIIKARFYRMMPGVGGLADERGIEDR